jgi:hypothetical protein
MRGRELYELTQLANKYVKGANKYVNGAWNSQVVQQLQVAWAARGDEQTRIEKRRRRLARKRVWASRWFSAWALITLLCGLLIVGVATGAVADGGNDALFGAIAATLVTAVITIRSAARLAMARSAQREFDVQYPRTGGTIAMPQPAAMPPKGSAAREPMRSLAEAERALSQVLAQLSASAAVPDESVAQARETSTEAATALRAVSAQLVAVELARDHAPPMERGPLVDGVNSLRAQLDEGLEGYRSLVAAAGRVVAASSAPGPKQELNDATDHLAGLAVALRELSDQSASPEI